MSRLFGLWKNWRRRRRYRRQFRNWLNAASGVSSSDWPQLQEQALDHWYALNGDGSADYDRRRRGDIPRDTLP